MNTKKFIFIISLLFILISTMVLVNKDYFYNKFQSTIKSEAVYEDKI